MTDLDPVAIGQHRGHRQSLAIDESAVGGLEVDDDKTADPASIWACRREACSSDTTRSESSCLPNTTGAPVRTS